jgi:hypothetical protein
MAAGWRGSGPRSKSRGGSHEVPGTQAANKTQTGGGLGGAAGVGARGGTRRRGSCPHERVLWRCYRHPRAAPDGRRVRGQLSPETGEEHPDKSDAGVRRPGGAGDVLPGGSVFALRHAGAARSALSVDTGHTCLRPTGPQGPHVLAGERSDPGRRRRRPLDEPVVLRVRARLLIVRSRSPRPDEPLRGAGAGGPGSDEESRPRAA